MTRVSDALTRARAAGADGAPAAQPTGSVGVPTLPPLDTASQPWAIEAPSPAQPAASHPEPYTTLAPVAAQPALPEPQGTWDRGADPKLIVAAENDPRSMEAYRRLAARLYLAQAERGIRLVMVTSALVGEGKTLTASNLALTLSESYRKRVLLIDADLRRPGVHELLRIPNMSGLNDGVRSDEERKVPLIRISEYLSVLTAGRPDPDPMSVLASARMRRILEDASEAFEWVIIDTPPVALLSDAHLLASLVDSVVLVVRAGETPVRAIKTAAEAVGRDRILGVVLNCASVPDSAKGYGYDYYVRA